MKSRLITRTTVGPILSPGESSVLHLKRLPALFAGALGLAALALPDNGLLVRALGVPLATGEPDDLETIPPGLSLPFCLKLILYR